MTEHPAPDAPPPDQTPGSSAARPWPDDRRSPGGLPTRRALMRLRQAEFVAADYLPAGLMQELTAAIEGVVAIVRGAAAGALPDEATTRARETLCRWAHERDVRLSEGDVAGAKLFGNWLFGAGILAHDLGQKALLDPAMHTQIDEPFDPAPPRPQVQP